jgi:hypothetical protein
MKKFLLDKGVTGKHDACAFAPPAAHARMRDLFSTLPHG